MNTSLYTLCIDYNGGTYLYQGKADTPKQLIDRWIDDYDYELIFSTEKITPQMVRNEWIATEKSLAAIDGLSHVWCLTFTIFDELFLVNIIQTDTLSIHE